MPQVLLLLLLFFFFFYCQPFFKVFIEGNDSPLQYSCLGNPMDRGIWWTIVQGVTKSWTGVTKQRTNNWICYNIAPAFYVLVFWPWSMWDLSPLTGIKPILLHRKVKSQLLDSRGSHPLRFWGYPVIIYWMSEWMNEYWVFETSIVNQKCTQDI